MGVIIPQVVTSDRASGAQVIDGSLKFDDSANQHLKRTISASNRRTFTLSVWAKHSTTDSNDRFLGNYTDSTNYSSFYIRDTPDFQISFVERISGNYNINCSSRRMARDTGWYHIVWAVDTTQSTDTDRVKLYVNGVQETLNEGYGSGVINTNAPTLPSQNYETRILAAYDLRVGARSGADCWDGLMSQFYVIDGQALGPEYFGFTDPLTNTWKPKKYVNTTASHGDAAGVVGFGTNGFYLPFDGSASIGQDQSGQGNNYTPVNFGGSVTLDSPLVTGARPILNTTQGGTQAGVGVFGSKQNVGYAVTVYDDGGGNKYYIDGVKQDTVTGLIRGATYTFDTSDSTVSSHPFRFSATSNGSHGGGSEYTNGVAAITGAATTITVPYNAPETLYYYCTSHSGMGADITGITTNEKLADQYASDCIFATPFVGIKSDVSVSIACTSTEKSLVDYGDPASSGAKSVFYSGSFYYDGNDGHDLGVINDTDFEMGSSDFCIEGWFNSNTTLDASYWNPILTLPWHGQNNTESQFFIGFAGADNGSNPAVSAGEFHARIRDSSGIKELESGLTTLYNDETWHHFALTKNGTTAALFVDGVLKKTVTTEASLNTGLDDQKGYIATYNNNTGTPGSPTGFYTGYLNDIRIYKGAAKYVGVTTGVQYFVPPSTSPDILPDTPSGVSGGSKLTISPDTSTEGAVSFDGDDYLSLSYSSDFVLDGDFTIECFVYFLSGSVMIDFTRSGSYANGWQLYNQTPTFYGYSSGSGGNASMTSDIPLSKGWNHLVVTRTISNNTARMFINGVQTASSTDFDETYGNDTSNVLMVGAQSYSGPQAYFTGYISNLRIIKGTALYTSNFTPPTAPLTNVTNTVLLCCQSNTSATEGAVKPGNITANGTAAASRFTPFNTDINTVRGQETGYATLNPLHRNPNGNTTSNGNLTQTTSAGNGHYRANFAISASSGKFYFEYQPTGSNVPGMVGLCEQNHVEGNNLNGTTAYSYYGTTGNKQGSPSNVDTSYGATFTFGDVIGVAFDSDNNTLEYFKNGISQGVAFTSFPNYPYYPAFSAGSSSNTTTYNVNFGQKPFKFPPPDGFQPLNTANTRPVNVISRPDQYVGISTWTGDNNDRFIEYGMKPDLFIVKSRNDNYRPGWFDSVRGFKNVLWSSRTAIQNNASSYPEDPTPTGITVNNDDGQTNQNTKTYVGWAFKAGGNKNTFNIDDVGYATAAAAGLDGGDITPTGASVGTKQGFSIIEFTGSASGTPSISHGLSKAPNFIAQKDTGATTSWRVFMYNGTTWSIMNFDDASGATGATETAPTSSLFYANGNGNAANTQIAYLWHDVPGLQKFGTFEGNGNADGPFIELGFRPSLILMRNLDNYGTNYDWCMYDNERAKFNPNDVFQCINLEKQDNVQGDNNSDNSRYVDFLSNGFKIRNTANTLNLNAHTIFYAAWAEAPSIDLYGGGANAR